MTFKLTNTNFYICRVIVKYFGYVLICGSIFSIGGPHKMNGLIEIYDLPNWLYIIAVLSLLTGITTSIYFFAKTHYFIGEICFLEDSIEIKNKRGKQKYTYNQLLDLNVKINNRPERMPVNRSMIEGGRNYIEFTFRNAKEKFEFYIASKKEQKELMLLIEKLGIKFNVIENL